MLLVTDIGNTNIVIGGMQGETIIFQARIATDRRKTSDEYGIEILKILGVYGVRTEDVSDCIISSVVPPVLNAVSSGLRKIIHKTPMVVGPGIKTGLNIQVDNPNRVGSDRIVATVGALEQYQPPLILLDLGTATTIEVVNSSRTYVGGCIIPGVRTSLDALTARTSQLPGISLETPERVIGNNTVECIRSGVLYGTASMIDGMLERLEEELGEKATVVATGGIAPGIVPLCRRKIFLEDDLILKGLYAIYRRNQKEKRF